MKTFSRILVANRGEIALRIARTCRAMGISTVAVYSDADQSSPYVRYTDEAVHLGSAASQDSYLNIDKIISAARRTGADAIHPGYGFLSEKAEFAEACVAAGIVFIGPSPQAIRQMGLKNKARRLMADAGVPVVPGYDGEDQSPETLRERILEIGFPVLIKASAGGGGKGMRIVRRETEIFEALDGARREAEKSFGDGSLLLEKFLEPARHVEVQILGDAHGNLIHLFERDCSVQRRHQKIIEESPSPAVDDRLRRLMGEAAVKAGRVIEYANAGTVEFLLTPAGEFYFIEVNTRLQVEHPVTEMTTGLDLVKLQIEIAEGRPLPLAQADLSMTGHAIEARLYAEDPEKDFLPSTGQILDWRRPEQMEGVRIDAGVEQGMEVGIHYDPMLGKVIAHAGDRATAIRKLSYALRALSIQGLQTNRQFLIRVLDHPEFLGGRAQTSFIDQHLDRLAKVEDREFDAAALTAGAFYLQQRRQAAAPLLDELSPGYRNNPYRHPSIGFVLAGRTVEVSWRSLSDSEYEATVFDSAHRVQVLCCEPDSIRISIDGIQRKFRIIESGERLYLHCSLGSRILDRLPRYPIRQSISEQGSANSPMPGQVLKILVETGQRVAAGDPLIILEAMKMEHTMRANVEGVIEAILVKQGEVVGPGQVLVKIA